MAGRRGEATEAACSRGLGSGICGRFLRIWFSPPDPSAWTAIGCRRHQFLGADPAQRRGSGGGEPLGVTARFLGAGALGLPVLAFGLKPPGRQSADRCLLPQRANTFLSPADLVAEFGGGVFGFGKETGGVIGVGEAAEPVEPPGD